MFHLNVVYNDDDDVSAYVM